MSMTNEYGRQKKSEKGFACARFLQRHVVFKANLRSDQRACQAARAKAKGVPVIAVVGGAEGDLSKAYGMGVTAIFTINRLPENFSVSRYKSEENLSETVDNIMRVLKI